MDAERAVAALTGLSVGDAFGDQFFLLDNRGLDPLTDLPPGTWEWSDDTEMACTVALHVVRNERIDQDGLAREFAERLDMGRRYGAGALELLEKIRSGADWRATAADGFGGNGSYGNGAAMWVAPLGAYFHGDLGRAADEARLSAEVTHAHAEGVAGAVAVAVAAAADPAELFDAVLWHLSDGYVRRGVNRARELGAVTPEEAARALGNGSRITAQDTVPFALWLVERFRDDYEQAVRACALVGGDTDTTAAITGGVIAAHHGAAVVPEAWLAAREPLPTWFSPL